MDYRTEKQINKDNGTFKNNAITFFFQFNQTNFSSQNSNINYLSKWRKFWKSNGDGNSLNIYIRIYDF